jgi:hypothetical protein
VPSNFICKSSNGSAGLNGAGRGRNNRMPDYNAQPGRL